MGACSLEHLSQRRWTLANGPAESGDFGDGFQLIELEADLVGFGLSSPANSLMEAGNAEAGVRDPYAAISVVVAVAAGLEVASVVSGLRERG